MKEIIAAIGIETTGLSPKMHDVVELAVVPLDGAFREDTAIEPFCARIRAIHPENAEPEALKLHGLDPLEGIEVNKAIVDLRMWAYDWHVSKIVPLAHNVDFSMAFLLTRFPELKELFVPSAGRDTMRFASIVNDICRKTDGRQVFGSLAFRAVRKVVGLPGEQSHRALDDARETACVYRSLMASLMPSSQMQGLC